MLKNNITHEDYKNCLFNGKIVQKDVNIIRHKEHDIYTEKINTLAYGHYKILNNKVSEAKLAQAPSQ